MIKKKGQAILETALVLPIILIVFCGIIDFGRIFHASTHLNMVTQEAVRLAGLGENDSEIVQFVNDKVYLVDKDTIQIDITPNSLLRKSGDYVTVKITYKVNYITPIISTFLPSPFEVNTQSTIRVE
ncbi:TadE/TadG family type IV pilus assembly protein [Clostridium ganghwense]|uniref:Pilus assembly protein n=1 Tax=Clostridium ganghwense TaxID=312089 RepID=A0ABT4CQI3_9CLOT|nr:TadE/TadG family type IV pilus assembly protein [Clostridium ganghwense]MCY6371178.1 pilus assembly protein [Clostridium ganghwense]